MKDNQSDANAMRVQEITRENFKKFGSLDIVAFSRAEPGAMGDGGAVVIVTADGCVYHANPEFGDISMEEVCQVCPPLKECQFMLFGGGKVPQGWNTVYLGFGNHLVVSDSIFAAFCESVEKQRIVSNAQLYGMWLDIVLNAI